MLPRALRIWSLSVALAISGEAADPARDAEAQRKEAIKDAVNRSDPLPQSLVPVVTDYLQRLIAALDKCDGPAAEAILYSEADIRPSVYTPSKRTIDFLQTKSAREEKIALAQAALAHRDGWRLDRGRTHVSGIDGELHRIYLIVPQQDPVRLLEKGGKLVVEGDFGAEAPPPKPKEPPPSPEEGEQAAIKALLSVVHSTLLDPAADANHALHIDDPAFAVPAARQDEIKALLADDTRRKDLLAFIGTVAVNAHLWTKAVTSDGSEFDIELSAVQPGQPRRTMRILSRQSRLALVGWLDVDVYSGK
jgi:hypothetical protein